MERFWDQSKQNNSRKCYLPCRLQTASEARLANGPNSIPRNSPSITAICANRRRRKRKSVRKGSRNRGQSSRGTLLDLAIEVSAQGVMVAVTLGRFGRKWAETL